MAVDHAHAGLTPPSRRAATGPIIEAGTHHTSAMCTIAAVLLTRIAAWLRNGTTYQLRDTDGRPITEQSSAWSPRWPRPRPSDRDQALHHPALSRAIAKAGPDPEVVVRRPTAGTESSPSSTPSASGCARSPGRPGVLHRRSRGELRRNDATRGGRLEYAGLGPRNGTPTDAPSAESRQARHQRAATTTCSSGWRARSRSRASRRVSPSPRSSGRRVRPRPPRRSSRLLVACGGWRRVGRIRAACRSGATVLMRLRGGLWRAAPTRARRPGVRRRAARCRRSRRPAAG